MLTNILFKFFYPLISKYAHISVILKYLYASLRKDIFIMFLTRYSKRSYSDAEALCLKGHSNNARVLMPPFTILCMYYR